MNRFGVSVATITAMIGGVVGAMAGSPAAHAAPRVPVAPAQLLPAPIVWGECATPGLAFSGAECGTLQVPLDYEHPGGVKIKLALSRIRHTTPDSQYQGVMLVNPGGPGGSGLIYSVLGARVPSRAGAAYDWIGFDPRGVGSSEPALACDGSYFRANRPFYVPVTAGLEQTWLQRSNGYAKACEANGGALLDHLKTTDSAKDIDSIRVALGQDKINYYGFSYGTYLGQVYSTLYPNRVRRMVLDGNVDPRKVWYQANLDQDVTFDRNIKIFFAWVARYDSIYHLGSTGTAVERLFYAERVAFIRHPAGGVIGPDEWSDIFVQAGYYVLGWAGLANAFAGWVHNGDWQTLRTLYASSNPLGAGADNGFAVYLGVQCTDAAWPTSWNRWRVDNWRTFAAAPFATWGNAWFNAPCISWGAKPGKPIEVDGSKAPAILLIGETLDAATPFEGGLEVRSRFPNSVLIEGVGGTTHAGSLNGVACTDTTIASYLATGALPARVPGRRSDLQCAPVPQPVPTGPRSLGPSTLSAGDLLTRQNLPLGIGGR